MYELVFQFFFLPISFGYANPIYKENFYTVQVFSTQDVAVNFGTYLQPKTSPILIVFHLTPISDTMMPITSTTTSTAPAVINFGQKIR